jgi:hypothetical protein
VLLYYLYYLVQQPQHASEVTDPDASPAEIDDPLERQRLTASHNTGTYSAATKDTEPLSAPELRTALLNFYEVHCPEKKDGKTLDAVVEGYANNKRAQIRLNQVLLQRYGTDLTGTSTGLPPSTVIMEAIEVADMLAGAHEHPRRKLTTR